MTTAIATERNWDDNSCSVDRQVTLRNNGVQDGAKCNAQLSVFMGRLRFLRKTIYFFAHNNNLIREEEYFLLYDVHKSRNLKLQDWSYDEFDLDLLTDVEWTSEFRFHRRDVDLLDEVLQMPDQRSYNSVIVDGIEALCIFLERFAYPCRYSDML